MSTELSGHVALVTGASRGIGRAVVVGLARAGAEIVAVGRDTDALKELGEEVGDIGQELLALRADLAHIEDIDEVVAEAWRWRGRIDVLVNAAGVMVRRGELEVSPEEWDQVFAVNVRGTFFLTQALGRRMLKGSGGAVVNVASVAGEVTTGASAPYSASKAALVQLTRVLAVRWAPAVRVNAVGPAYVRTALNASWLEVPENRDFVLSRTPLGRVGEPEDVVGAVVFLASPAASYVTGQHLLIDGGWTAE